MRKLKLFSLLAALVCAANMWAWSGSGTSGDPYLIANTTDWNTLATNVSGGNTYSGVYFKQTADISVTTHVGYYESNSNYRTFNGTYDGDGHTLTVTYSSRYRCAPFEMVEGATIKNLHTAGTITTSSQDASGLIGCIRTGDNTTNIINCRSSVVINSSTNGDGTHAGFIGITRTANMYNDGGAKTVNIIGCIFDGQLNGSNTHSCGGFIGWAEGTANTYTIKDCIFAPSQVTMSTSNSCTFARYRSASTLHFINCYYTQTLGSAQGKQIRSITAGDGVTSLAPAGTVTVYNVSGITSYGTGIAYGGNLYAGNGDAISLNLDHAEAAEGYLFNGYSVDNGTLAGTANPYTLTLADANTTISAEWIPPFAITAKQDPQNAGVYYSTFYHGGADYVLPAGVEAYVADLSGSDLVLTKIAEAGQVIPNDNAVILKAGAENISLIPTDATPVSFSATNDLEGVDAITAVTSIDGLTTENCYVLSGSNENGVGFYRINSENLKAHKAYVKYSGTQNNAPRRMRFVFEQENTTTGVDSAQPSVISGQKLIENGQLIIIKNGVRYNAQGQIVK